MESQINNAISNPLASCQVCGRRDETIRTVVYPYVISLLFITFRRSFAGIWCQRHRRRYLFFSSTITACLGWLGIPYGLFYTPITLLTLARGGVQDPLLTSQLLSSLAEQKLLANDPQEAIRCFEESLRFRENPEIQEKLARLHLQYRASSQPGTVAAITSFLAVPILLVLSMLTGLLVGIADIVISYLMAPLFNSSGTIITVIVSWLPLVTTLFLGILFIRSRTEWTLRKIRCTDQVFGTILAIFAPAFALYSILEGRAIINSLPSMLTTYGFSLNETLFGTRAILSYGGILELINFLQTQELYAVIYLVLFGAGAVLSLYVGMESALAITRWQNQLGNLRKSAGLDANTSSSIAWIWLAVIVGAVLLSSAVLFPGRFVNLEKANQQMDNASYALDNEDWESALPQLKQAIEIWPDSVKGHTMLGLLYLKQEKYDLAQAEAKTALEVDSQSLTANFLMAIIEMAQNNLEGAIENLKLVSTAQPALAVPHAYLAILYYMTDQPELASQEISEAEKYEDGDSQISSMIGSYYLSVNDFGEAEKHVLKAVQDPSATSDDYLLLARVYGIEKKYDKAKRAIEKAAELGAEQADIHLSRADLRMLQGDLPGALSEILGALKASPDNSEAHANLSFVYFQQGNFDEAAAEAERALESDPYNYQAYIEQAFAYHAQGRIAEAIAAAQKGAAYSPKTDRAHYILGLAYMDSGMKEEAIHEFEEFLNLYWDRPLGIQYKENAENYLKQIKQ